MGAAEMRDVRARVRESDQDTVDDADVREVPSERVGSVRVADGRPTQRGESDALLARLASLTAREACEQVCVWFADPPACLRNLFAQRVLSALPWMTKSQAFRAMNEARVARTLPIHGLSDGQVMRLARQVRARAGSC